MDKTVDCVPPLERQNEDLTEKAWSLKERVKKLEVDPKLWKAGEVPSRARRDKLYVELASQKTVLEKSCATSATKNIFFGAFEIMHRGA